MKKPFPAIAHYCRDLVPLLFQTVDATFIKDVSFVTDELPVKHPDSVCIKDQQHSEVSPEVCRVGHDNHLSGLQSVVCSASFYLDSVKPSLDRPNRSPIPLCKLLVRLLSLSILPPQNPVFNPISTDKLSSAYQALVPLNALHKPVFSYYFRPTVIALFLFITFDLPQS